MSISSQGTPMIRGALRLVEIALMIVLVAIAATAGYSGYQEYRALTSLAGTSNIQGSLNGTKYSITGIEVPNNMSYPLSLSILGQVSLEHSPVANFTSGKQMIQPGQTKNLSISFDLNFTKALESNSVLFQKLLFNQTKLFVNSTVQASIAPLLDLSLASSANETLGPVLQNLEVQLQSSQAQLSTNQSALLVPLAASWINNSPLSFNGTVQATLVAMPGQPLGDHGSASAAVVILSSSPGSLAMILEIPLSSLLNHSSLPSGNYEVQFTIDAYGTSAVFDRNVTI